MRAVAPSGTNDLTLSLISGDSLRGLCEPKDAESGSAKGWPRTLYNAGTRNMSYV